MCVAWAGLYLPTLCDRTRLYLICNCVYILALNVLNTHVTHHHHAPFLYWDSVLLLLLLFVRASHCLIGLLELSCVAIGCQAVFL